MSLFSELRRLYRTDRFQIEDTHTEIAAQILRNSDVLTLGWLHRLGVTALQKAKISISTQERFEMLAKHTSSSRPDITIRLKAADKAELIFVESKLPSVKGDDQLQRYADHLASAYNSKNLSKASLIFITRDYEAAEKPIVQNSPFQPGFFPTRWFQFYQHLKAHLNGDGLASQFKLFMEENHMSLGNQFRSTDLVALDNFLSAKALMDETLQGEVSDCIKNALGKVSSLKQAMDQLLQFHRYILYRDYEGLECLIGYWLPHENIDEPVWVGVDLFSHSNAEAAKAFRDWRQKTGSWLLYEENEWSSIKKRKPIHALMDGTDHVRTIKDHLLGLLAEVNQFRTTYPELFKRPE